MEVHTGTGRFGLLVGIAAGVVTGAALMAFAEIRGRSFDGGVVDVAEFLVQRGSWRWDWWLAGALAGGFVGAFGSMLWNPRLRLARGTLAVIEINCVAWVMFLAFTPEVEAIRFEEIAGQRATVDRYGPGSISVVSDVPTILAARDFGGFRHIPPPEMLLSLMAGLPVAIAEEYVVPGRYAGSRPTRRESYVIAVIAFVVSTAFWATVSEAIGSLSRRKGRTVAS